MSVRPFGKLSALVLVDIQNDFCDGGICAVKNSKDIVTICNLLRKQLRWDAVVVAQDWHPADHVSFCKTNIMAGRYCKIGDTVDVDGVKQKMWADHCVQGSEGADPPADLDNELDDIVIQKGTDPSLDSYSGFYAADGVTCTTLEKQLRKLNITDVYVCGLGTEYGVGGTALDASRLGFNTYIVQDAISGTDDALVKETANKLEKAGVTTITSSVLLDAVQSNEDRRQEAAAYMEEHDINTLFQNLCTSLVYSKPEDPKNFLVKELQRLQKQKTGDLNKISMLTDEDLETMFQMLDPIKTGTLSAAQVLKALKGLALQPTEAIGEDERFNITKFKQVFLSAK